MDVHRIVRSLKRKLKIAPPSDKLILNWVKRDKTSWLGQLFAEGLPEFEAPPAFEKIESLALKASQLGDMPLWKGFEKLEDYPFPVKDATRNANQVRVDRTIGRFLYYLTLKKKPETILEIGTAFGVSGMYWLSGLSENNKGHLYTFEPNEIWAKIADSNLLSIEARYTLTVSTFEEKHSDVLKKDQTIDIAFIDAIHTSEVVNAQYDLISKYAKSGSLILFDDIEFSKDMWGCWKSISKSEKVKSSFFISDRVGIVELK